MMPAFATTIVAVVDRTIVIDRIVRSTALLLDRAIGVGMVARPIVLFIDRARVRDRSSYTYNNPS